MDNDSWGAGDTETVGACPLCASRARTLLHGELVDRVFFTAPGPWQLWRCDACGAGYLDPRPTPAAIGRAYRTYFTHDQALPPTPSGERLGLLARLKRAALNDYLQAAFGYRLRPALPFGRLAFALRADKALAAAEMVRHLPAPRQGDRLLDIGCGDGGFLLMARDRLGFEVRQPNWTRSRRRGPWATKSDPPRAAAWHGSAGPDLHAYHAEPCARARARSVSGLA